MKCLILFHGYTTNSDDLKPIYDYFINKYDLVICKNFPGHSDPRLKGFKYKDTITFAKDVCDDVFSKYDCVDIIGYSMGGAITSYLALEYKFNKIILLAPANKYINYFTSFSFASFFFKYLLCMHHKKFKEALLSDCVTSIKLAPMVLKRFNYKSVYNFMKVIDYCNKKIKSSDNKIDNVVVIYGKLDSMVPYSSINFIKSHSRNMKLYTIENATHILLRSKYNKEILKIIIKEMDVN